MSKLYSTYIKRRKLIMINGPKRAGKDTLSDAFVDMLGEVLEGESCVNRVDVFSQMKLAQPISDALQACFGFDDVLWTKIREDYKELPFVNGYDTTLRQAMINFSEVYLKKTFGEEIFGVILWNKIVPALTSGINTILVSDCGFQTEFDYIMSRPLPDDLDVFLINVKREGFTHEGDSREDVSAADYPNVIQLGWENKGDVYSIIEGVDNLLSAMMCEKR